MKFGSTVEQSALQPSSPTVLPSSQFSTSLSTRPLPQVPAVALSGSVISIESVGPGAVPGAWTTTSPFSLIIVPAVTGALEAAGASLEQPPGRVAIPIADVDKNSLARGQSRVVSHCADSRCHPCRGASNPSRESRA